MKKIFKDNYGVNKLFIKNLIIYFIIMIIVVVMPIILLYSNLNNKYYTQMKITNSGTLNRAIDTFDTMVSQVEIYAVDLYVKQEVKAFIAAENEHYFLEDVRDYLKFYKRINNYVDHIYIYNAKKDYVVANDGYRPALENEKKTILNPGTQIAEDIYFDAFTKNNKYPYVIRIAKKFNEGSFVAVDIDLRKLNDIINAETIDEEHNKIFVLDKDKKIICSDNMNNYFGINFDEVTVKKDDIMTELDGELYVYETSQSQKYPVQISSLTNVEYFAGVRIYTVLYTVSIIFAAFILSFVIAYFITVRSINPIRHIIGALKMRKPDYNLVKKMPKEVVYIIEDLLKTIKSENEIMRDTNTRLLLFKMANMEALQSQINPHFLHNTIDSINWLVYFQLGKNNKISKLLADLSDLYRITLQTDNYIIPLDKEIQHIIMYVNLLNVRFENSINLEIDIKKELLGCDVLKFMLQPIVENSVYHGIIPSQSEGTIRVAAESDSENIYVYVDDNGVGMSDEMIDKINRELEKGPDELDDSILKVMYGNEYVNATLQDVRNSWWLNRKKSDIGVGVKNTNNRIKLIFGDEYCVSVSKLKNKGTRVTIKLPLSNKKYIKE